MTGSWFYNALAFLLAAVIFVPLFRKMGLGAILGYLVAGVFLGPYVLNLVNDPEAALHFAEFGVIMLLFIIGLELEPNKLWQMRYKVGLLGSAQMLVTAIIIGFSVYLMMQDWQLAWLLGITLALSSTAFAIQLMAEFRILPTPLGRLGFAILLLQDLAVVPFLFVVDTLSVAQAANTGLGFVKPTLALIALIVFGRFGLNPLLRMVSNYGSREVMTAAALLIVLGSAEFLYTAGLSKGLGAFVAGLLLANSYYRHHLETDIEPFKGLLLGLFFIAVGLNINIDLLFDSPWKILLLACLLTFVKTAVIACIAFSQKHSIKEAFFLGVLLGQGGEFAFVVMTQALSGGLVTQVVADQVVLVVSLSMAMTAPLALWIRTCFLKPNQHASEGAQLQTAAGDNDDKPEVIIAGFGRFGQIIGRILAAHKIPFTALDKDPRHVEFVRHLGNRLFYGDATRADLLENAGIANAKVLVIATDDVSDSMRIAQIASQYGSDLRVIARARNRAHAYQLHAAGIKQVVRETFESSLQAAIASLMELGYTEGQALESIDRFKMHDERMLMDAVKHKDDFDALLKISKEGRRELEQLFKKD